MLKWALIFLAVAIIAGLTGFSGVAGAASTIAFILFGLCLLVAIGMFLAGAFIVKKVV